MKPRKATSVLCPKGQGVYNRINSIVANFTDKSSMSRFSFDVQAKTFCTKKHVFSKKLLHCDVYKKIMPQTINIAKPATLCNVSSNF